MKPRRRKLALALATVCLAALPVWAQATRDIAGTWQGTLPTGKGQRVVLKVSKEDAKWRGVVYNLDGGLAYEGRATTQMSLQGEEVRFAIAPIEADYEGRLSDDGAAIAGTWTQSGKTYALSLTRVEGDAQWEIPREDAAMAKAADPDWEVATVKLSDPNDTNSGFQTRGRRVFIERKTVKSMLIFGYGMHEKQLVGMPDWAESERWDVDGVPDVPGHSSLQQLQSLVRKILAERFGLTTHLETREMSVYAITLAKGGAKLEKSAGNPDGPMDENDNDNGGQRTVHMTNATIGELGLLMKFFLDRPVVDQTGLATRYDFQLKYTFDDTKAPTDGTAAPSLFTAIQEELGLKLEPVKAPTDVMVIDKVERPSAN
jgi:uncharacterized protein (TIGR03435 family)